MRIRSMFVAVIGRVKGCFMGNNKNNNANASKYLSLVLAFIAAAMGVLCFVWFAEKCTAKFTQILTYIAGVILCALALMCVVYFALSFEKKQKPNFFLFDKSRGKNIPVSELDFSMVDEKMSLYMRLVANDVFELWQGESLLVKFRDNTTSETVRAYLPIVIYKMLYDLSCDDDVNVWDAFLAADREVLSYVCHILERLGDGEISKVLNRLYDTRKDYSENIRACICANTEFFKARMLGYVRRNIARFY